MNDCICKRTFSKNENVFSELAPYIMVRDAQVVPIFMPSGEDAEDIAEQIVELLENSQDIFMDTFTRIIPFGDFYKKDKAAEIVRKEVSDNIMRQRMLRILVLIPEKKSVHLAQKAMA